MTNSQVDDFFVLHANCIPVKGASRSVICDLQNNQLKLIPNDLFIILTEHSNKTVSEVKKTYNNEFDEIIDEYFDFLSTQNFGFFTKFPDRFPKLNLQWDSASEITNSIIDVDENSSFDITKILFQLNGLNCKHVQIRYYKSPKIIDLVKITDYLESIKSCIISIDFVLQFDAKIDRKEYENLLLNPRLFSISMYNSPIKKIVQLPESKKLIFTTEAINSHLYCGIISSEYFSVNIKNFTESLQFNSCLNKKISVDARGQIKNCPSMTQGFGNINEISLKNALLEKDFTKNWTINKDQINTCKECEFRHVCTDCRAFRENPDDDFSKPLKCGYDPYTNQWEDWTTNPLKQKAITYYGMQELVKTNPKSG